MSHQHQSLRLIKVADSVKPDGTEWFECKCGQQLLMQIICQLPPRTDEVEAAKAGVRIERSYVALDETTYDTVEQARARNRLVIEVEGLEKFLEQRSIALEHGDGYIQQDPARVDQLRAHMIKMAAKEFKLSINDSMQLEAVLDDHYDEADPDHPFFKLYNRLKCIDQECREWQNPALAQEPQAGKQVQLNPGPVPNEVMEGSNEQ